MERFVYGVDIGGTAVKLGLFTEAGDLLEKWEIPSNTENEGASVAKDIADTIAGKCASRSISKEQVIGIGVGVPGPVRSDGFVSQCPNLRWHDRNVNEELTALTGVPCIAANDANVAALGEAFRGGGAGIRNMVLVTLGTGVGGGIVVDGEIVYGVNGAAGEIGHMVVNQEETEQCGCEGYGHLEQYTSAKGIVRMAKQRLERESMSSVLRDKEELSAKDVFDAAKDSDALALAVVDDFGRILAGALGCVAAVVEPEVFVIGGGVSRAGQIILDVVEKHYNDRMMKALRNKKFVLATLGNDAGIYGSAKLILDRFVS